VLNTGVFDIIDKAMGSKLELDVTGVGSYELILSAAQAQYMYYEITGTLTEDLNIIFPAKGRMVIIQNYTNGDYVLGVAPVDGSGYGIAQGSRQLVQFSIDAGDPSSHVKAQSPQNKILPIATTLASATTTDLGNAGSHVVEISGTTTITSFGSNAIYQECLYFIQFEDILTLTHNASSLILPGGANITTAAGDCAIMKYEDYGNWRCLQYTVAAATPGGGGVTADSTATFTHKTYDTAATGNVFKINGATVTEQDNSVQDFRLTLTTGVPVTTADVTAAATIYCTPYKGNRIALYDGTHWNVRSSAEFSLGLGTISSGKPYDVFCYDNAGTPTLEFLAWTNDTTRATALAYQDGILCKTGAVTRRYLGTFYTTATTTTEDSSANRYLWNYYNRVIKKLEYIETTATWAYSTAAWRIRNNSTNNKLSFISGLAEDALRVSNSTAVQNSTSTIRMVYAGIGLDTVTDVTNNEDNIPSTNAYFLLGGTNIMIAPQLGKHYVAAMEYGNGTDTQTWSGSSINSYINTAILG